MCVYEAKSCKKIEYDVHCINMRFVLYAKERRKRGGSRVQLYAILKK